MSAQLFRSVLTGKGTSHRIRSHLSTLNVYSAAFTAFNLQTLDTSLCGVALEHMQTLHLKSASLEDRLEPYLLEGNNHSPSTYDRSDDDETMKIFLQELLANTYNLRSLCSTNLCLAQAKDADCIRELQVD